ncbi:hypothetical protein P8H27_04330 [Pseudomonas sp. sp1636]|uniref:hypothetical protein n=1 Tax=Pseudomonas sp. sp1636 TaxID=3036707 RepID=UPI0025A4F48F|nr:hypothetical protein [Pseudomonas sp. sp1636]MDM8348120.1 hypothetical protein [Pseudomonas sp. sp1636]
MGKPHGEWQSATKALVAAQNLRVGSGHAMKHPAGWTPVIFLPVWHLQNFSGLSADGWKWPSGYRDRTHDLRQHIAEKSRPAPEYSIGGNGSDQAESEMPRRHFGCYKSESGSYHLNFQGRLNNGK